MNIQEYDLGFSMGRTGDYPKTEAEYKRLSQSQSWTDGMNDGLAESHSGNRNLGGK